MAHLCSDIAQFKSNLNKLVWPKQAKVKFKLGKPHYLATAKLCANNILALVMWHDTPTSNLATTSTKMLVPCEFRRDLMIL